MSIGLYIIQVARRLLAEGYAEVGPGRPPFSGADLPLLISVYHQPGVAATRLTEYLGRDKTTVSRTVSRLTAAGIVQSEIDSRDGRRKGLYLTPEGARITRLIVSRINEEIERLTSEMDDAEAETVEEFLKRLRSSE